MNDPVKSSCWSSIMLHCQVQAACHKQDIPRKIAQMPCTTAVCMNGLPGSTGGSRRQGMPSRRRPRGMCQLTALGWWPRSAGAGIPWQRLQARAQTPACNEQQRANPDYPITILLRSITWCVTRLSSHGSEVARLHPKLKVVTQQMLGNAVHMNCSLLLQDCCKFYLGGRIL